MNAEDWHRRAVTSALCWLKLWKPCRTGLSFTSKKKHTLATAAALVTSMIVLPFVLCWKDVSLSQFQKQSEWDQAHLVQGYFVDLMLCESYTRFSKTWIGIFTWWISRNTPASVKAKNSRSYAGRGCWDWGSGDGFSFRPIFCLVCCKGCHSHEIKTGSVFPFGKSVCFLPLLYQLPTSHTQTQPGIFTWRLGPVLLCLDRYTLDEFGTARRSAVVRGFIDALTRGGPGGTPRPIEMHSHDPMRYISVRIYSGYREYIHCWQAEET